MVTTQAEVEVVINNWTRSAFEVFDIELSWAGHPNRNKGPGPANLAKIQPPVFQLECASHGPVESRGCRDYIDRQKKLRSLVANDWPNPKISDARLRILLLLACGFKFPPDQAQNILSLWFTSFCKPRISAILIRSA